MVDSSTLAAPGGASLVHAAVLESLANPPPAMLLSHVNKGRSDFKKLP